MSENQEMMDDAMQLAIEYYLSDWPTYLTPYEIVDIIEEGEHDGAVIRLDEECIAFILIWEPYAYVSGSDLAQMIRSRAQSYVDFAEKWRTK